MIWINVPPNIEDYEGFVYCITNLDNGKKYIGKKAFWSNIKLPPLKGRTKKEKERRAKLKGNKRHVKKESDWKDYYGSSKELLLDVEKQGKNRFKREIKVLCKGKWEMAYFEAKMQFDNDVLLRDDYYNGILNLRVCKAPKELRLK